MRALLFASLVSAGLVPVHAALADCNEDLERFNKTITSGSGDQDYRIAMTGATARQVRQLRDAARIFGTHQMDDACSDVIAGIRDLLDARREELTHAKEPQGRETWTAAEVERLKQAAPVTKLKKPLRLDEIIGSDLRNPANESLGEVADVVFSFEKGGIDYAVVRFGGFLGLGEKRVAVPWNALRVTPERDVLILNMSEAALNEAPAFEPAESAEAAAAWRETNDKYFATHAL